MIIDMLNKSGLQKDQLIKANDTIADVPEGENGVVKTVAVLAEDQDKNKIIKQQPDLSFIN